MAASAYREGGAVAGGERVRREAAVVEQRERGGGSILPDPPWGSNLLRRQVNQSGDGKLDGAHFQPRT